MMGLMQAGEWGHWKALPLCWVHSKVVEVILWGE
jgi:hypothetical protein